MRRAARGALTLAALLVVSCLPGAAAERAGATRDPGQVARDVGRSTQRLGQDVGAGLQHLQQLAGQVGQIEQLRDEAGRKADEAARAVERAEEAARKCNEAAFRRLADRARRAMKEAQDLQDRADAQSGELGREVQRTADRVNDHIGGLYDQLAGGFEAAERAGLKPDSVIVSNLRRAEAGLDQEVARQGRAGTEAQGRRDEGALSQFNRALDEFAGRLSDLEASTDPTASQPGLDARLARAAEALKDCGKKVARARDVTVALNTAEPVIVRFGPMSDAELRALLAAQNITEYGALRIPDDAGGGWLVSYRPPGAGPSVGSDAERDHCREYLPEGKGRGGRPTLGDLRTAEQEARTAFARTVREFHEVVAPGPVSAAASPVEIALARARIREAEGRVKAVEAARAARAPGRVLAQLPSGAPAPGSEPVRGTVSDARGNPLDATVMVQEPTPTPEEFVEGKDHPWTEQDAGTSTLVPAGPDGRFSIPGDVSVGGALLVGKGWAEKKVPVTPEDPTVVAGGPKTPDGPRVSGPPGGSIPRDPKPPVSTPRNGPPPEDPPPPPPEEPPPPPPPRPDPPKPCCRLVGVNLFYPVTDDWLTPAPMQEAFNEPAIGASQVFLHDGSFFQDTVALYVKAVGHPFEISHHYRSNVTTKQGGLLGHKRDLSYNKRIVPLAQRKAESNSLFVEQFPTEKVPLLYLDGRGRVDRYEVLETDFVPRRVRNFGAEFRAFVTTYKSPPGAFHEIQRYVLPDGEPHPFERHPNVEKAPDPNKKGLVFTERVFYVLRDKHGFRRIFNCRGQLIYASDRNENLMTFLYNTALLNPLTQNPVLKTIVDTNGRSYELDYRLDLGQGEILTNILCEVVRGRVPIPRLKSVTDFDGRKLVFAYRGGADDLDLESVSWEPFGPGDLERGITFETRYTYTGEHLLETVKAPREVIDGGPEYLRVTWSGTRVSRLKVGGSRAGRNAGGEFEIAPPGATVVVRDRAGNSRRYDLKRLPDAMVVERITLTGARGANRGPWVTEFKNHNADYQVGEIVLPKGHRLVLAYDDDNLPIVQGAVRNRAEDYTYKNDLTRGNLLSITRVSTRRGVPDLVTAFEYEPLFNQVAKRTDPRQHAITYRYANPFPNSFFNKVSGDNGNPKTIEMPETTRPDGSKLTLRVEHTYYPTDGLLATRTDTGGHATTHLYESGVKASYLKAIQYPGERSVSFEPDTRGNVLRATDMGGTVTRFDVSKRDLVDRKIQDANGFSNRTDYFYDRNGNVVRVVVDRKDNFENPRGEQPGPTSRFWGRITRQLTYDLLNRPIEVVEDAVGADAAKLATTIFYDPNENVEAVETPSPAPGAATVRTTYTHEGRDLVESITRAGVVTIQHAYDAHGNLEASTDPRCGATTVAAAMAAGPTPACPLTRYAYDEFDRLQRLIDPLSGELEYVRVNANGYPEEVRFTGTTGAEGGGREVLSRMTYRYDELDRRIEQKQYVLRGVDTQGRVAADAGGAITTQWFYDRDGLVEKVVGPGAGETVFAHDALHRQTRVTDAEGNQTEYEYDKAGNVEVIKEVARERSVDPDTGAAVDRTVTYTTRLSHDALGRPTSRTDPGGHTSRIFYDSLDAVRGAVEDGYVSVMVYDGLRRLRQRSGAGQQVSYTYTPAGTVRSARSAAGERAWEYDVLGRVVKVEEEVTGFSAPTAALRTVERRVTRIAYDPAGNPTVTTDPNGTEVTTTFNALNLPTAVSIRPAPNVLGPEREGYRYDGLGRLVYAESVSAEHGAAAVAFAYDGLGRPLLDEQIFRGDRQTVLRSYPADLAGLGIHYPALARLGGGRGPTLDVRHDKLGRAVRLLVEGRDAADYLYAGSDRVSWRRAGNTVQTHVRFDQERKPTAITVRSDASGLLWQSVVNAYAVHRPVQASEGFFAGGRLTEGSTVTTRLDAAGRPVASVTEQTTGLSAGTLRSVRSETLREYDGAGQVVKTVEFAYEDARRLLTSVRSDAYTYREPGRIASTTTSLAQNLAFTRTETTVDRDGRPETTSNLDFAQAASLAEAAPNPEVQDFEYDANGNLVADTRFVYAYDHRNRLTRVIDKFKRGLGPIELRGTFVNFSVSYVYDPLGRRVLQDFRPKVADLPGSRFPDPKLQDARFLYDGPRVIAEVDVDRTTGRAGPLLARYFHGAQPHELLRMDRRRDDAGTGPLETFYFHDDFHGAVRFLTSDRTATVERAVAADVGVVEDERVIEGSTTRVPYTTWTTRQEAFSGAQYREDDSSFLFNYRSAPRTFARLAVPDTEFFQLRRAALSAQEKKRQLLVLAVSLGPFAVEGVVAGITLAPAAFAGGGLSGGLTGVVADYGLTRLMGGEYSLEKGLIAFGLGAVSGGTAGVAMRTLGAASKLAAATSFAVDTAVGTGFDMAYYGDSLQHALITNLAFNTLGAGVGAAVGRAVPHRGAPPAGAKAVAVASRTRAAMRSDGWLSKALDDLEIEADPSNQQVWDRMGRTAQSAINARVIQVIELQARSGDKLARIFMRAYNRGKVRVDITPDHFPGYKESYLGYRRRIGGRHVDPDLFINPFGKGGKLRSAGDLAGTVMHEFVHMLGGNEFQAWYHELQFLLRVGVADAAGRRYLLAQKLSRIAQASPLVGGGPVAASMWLHHTLVPVYVGAYVDKFLQQGLSREDAFRHAFQVAVHELLF